MTGEEGSGLKQFLADALIYKLRGGVGAEARREFARLDHGFRREFFHPKPNRTVMAADDHGKAVFVFIELHARKRRGDFDLANLVTHHTSAPRFCSLCNCAKRPSKTALPWSSAA